MLAYCHIGVGYAQESCLILEIGGPYQYVNRCKTSIQKDMAPIATYIQRRGSNSFVMG